VASREYRILGNARNEYITKSGHALYAEVPRSRARRD
jgi:hypothetical protein